MIFASKMPKKTMAVKARDIWGTMCLNRSGKNESSMQKTHERRTSMILEDFRRKTTGLERQKSQKICIEKAFLELFSTFSCNIPRFTELCCPKL